MTNLLKTVLLTASLYCVVICQCGDILDTNGRGFHPILTGPTCGFPGMKVRLTSKGLQYVNDVAAGVLNERIPKLNIDEIKRELPEGKGKITIRTVRVIHFKPADKYEIKLVPSDKVKWSMKNMDIGMYGQISGKYGLMDLNGQLDFRTGGVNFEIVNAFNLTDDQKPKIQSVSCKASIGDADMAIHNGGLSGLIINVFKGLAIQQLLPVLEKEICTMARKFADETVNEKLSSFPTKIALNNSKQFDFLGQKPPEADAALSSSTTTSMPTVRHVTVQSIEDLKPTRTSVNTSRFGVNLHGWLRKKRQLDKLIPTEKLQQGLWLDYGLLEKPRIFGSHLETRNRGEVSYEGRGRTPFHPEPMMEPLFIPDRMLYLLASDFIPNSMLYHAYRQGLLRFEMANDNGEFGQFLQTTCEDEFFAFCIGDVLPGLGELYPNRPVEMLFHPTRAPTMVFHRDGGRINLDTQGLLFLFIKDGPRLDRKRQVLSATVHLTADTQVGIKDDKIIGKVKVNRFAIKPRRVVLKGVDGSALAGLSDFAAGILEGMANDLLAQGMPMPLIKGAKLVSPRIIVLDRVMRIDTDLEVEENTIMSIAGNALDGMAL